MSKSDTWVPVTGVEAKGSRSALRLDEMRQNIEEENLRERDCDSDSEVLPAVETTTTTTAASSASSSTCKESQQVC